MAHVKVPENATGTGSCDSMNPGTNQVLYLSWGGDSNNSSLVTLTFESNTTSKEFWLGSIAASIAVDNATFPGIKETVSQIKLSNSTKHFVTPMDNSYNCPSLLNIPASLTPKVVNNTAFFTMNHFQLEAFKNSTSNNFSTAIFCEGDNKPDLVPILVGCSLVGLVVIVLAVYLWGRRRSQRGYHSM